VEIFAKRGVERVLENVREFSGDFGEAQKAVTGGGAA